MSFERQIQRQMQRASLNEQMGLIEETVNALNAENNQLKMELRSLYRAVGAIVAVSATGEVRIPLDKIDDLLKGKSLQSNKDDATNEVVFTLAGKSEESSDDVATK